jgi:putative hemin transport protein
MRPKRIREEFSRLLEAQPEAGLRKSAAQLKITEAELVAAHSGEGPVIRLNDDYEGQLNGLKKLGEVVAVTRSPHVIHEVRGCYPDARIFGKQGLMVSDTIDLRLRMDHWAAGFSVCFNDRRQIVYFDEWGQAVHRLFATDASDTSAWEAWQSAHAAEKQSSVFEMAVVDPPPENKAVESESEPDPEPETGDEVREIEREDVCRAWDALKDAHDFIPMLDHLGIERLAALRLAGEPYARRLSKEALIRLLKQAQKTALPIMVFAYSRGCTQIYSGILGQVEEFGEWLNVLDPGFNLHLELKGVDTVWSVWKPNTEDGVTSIEVFDRAGELILQFYGVRQPQEPENPDWRELCHSLPAPDAADDI